MRLAAAIAISAVMMVGAQARTPPGVAAFVATSLRNYHVPGAGVMLVDGGETSFIGFGASANGRPVTATTRFYIGSLSKAFTAAAVLQLAERGSIDLDMPVRRYLPEFRLADSRSAGLTIRHLLNQTSGMTIGRDREWQLPQPRNLKEAVARLAPLRLAFDPGTGFSYHNPNYTVLARLVEVTSGLSFSAYMRTNIFLPLDMTDTATVDFMDEDRDHVPLGHLYAFGRAFPIKAPPYFINGAGGVVTTPADYARWLEAQMRGGVGRSGARILSAASLRAAQTPSARSAEYGFGWNRSASGRISHAGGLATFGAYAAMQGGRGVAVFVPVTSVMAPSRDIALGILEAKLAPLERGGLWLWDFVLVPAILLSWFFCARGIARSRAWAGRMRGKAAWRQILAFAPQLLIAGIILIGVPLAVSQAVSWSWIWLWYYLPVWTTFLLSCAGAAILVAAARLVFMSRAATAGVAQANAPIGLIERPRSGDRSATV
jgi:CubicO group peptidase (beta-lactamase class C family)